MEELEIPCPETPDDWFEPFCKVRLANGELIGIWPNGPQIVMEGRPLYRYNNGTQASNGQMDSRAKENIATAQTANACRIDGRADYGTDSLDYIDGGPEVGRD